MSRDAVFCRLIEEHGNAESQSQNLVSTKAAAQTGGAKGPGTADVDAALMQAEERNTGAVSWAVYKKYLQSAGGIFWAPVILFLLLLGQADNGAFSCAILVSLPQLGYSCYYTVPRILDGRYDPWIQVGRLHSYIRSSWSVGFLSLLDLPDKYIIGAAGAVISYVQTYAFV